MARIRTIKPEMPADPTLAKVSRDARLTFVYLISQADDYGLIAAMPRQLLGLLFPHDEVVTTTMLSSWVDELAAAGLVAKMTATDGQPVVRLVNWERHQRVDNRSRSSLLDRLPGIRQEATGGDSSDGAEGVAEVRGENPRVAASRGGSPLGRGVGKGRGIGEGRDHRGVSAADRGEVAAEFEAAWAAYPSRPNNAKAKALKAYLARRESGVTAEALHAGVVAYAAYVQATGTPAKFVKMASTFFGPDEHWLTDYAVPDADPLADAPPEVRACILPNGKVRLWEDLPDGETRPTAAMQWLAGRDASGRKVA